MESEFSFRELSYENVRLEHDLPFRCFFNSVGYVGSHWHRELEIVLQVRGEIAVSMPGGTAVLRPGDLFLANPFEVHSIVERTADNLELALQIDLSDPTLLPRLIRHRRFQPPAAWGGDATARVARQLAALTEALVDRRDGFAFDCLASLATIVALLVRHASRRDEPGSVGEARPGWFDHVSAIIAFLEERCAGPVSLDDVARHVGLSRYYVSHLVKEATGLSLQENLGLIRTNRAIHLMFTTDARLVDIALDAGFSHLRYFNKYFRALYGETPSELRRRGGPPGSSPPLATRRVQHPTRELVELVRTVTGG